MKRLCEMSLSELIDPKGHLCSCGRRHSVGLKYVRAEKNAISLLPEALETLGAKRPFIVCDRHTRDAAWNKVKNALESASIDYVSFCFTQERVEPDEIAVGTMTMAFVPECDSILALGSGVINDCCKVLSHVTGRPQITVATAPSMDGYASNSSAMILSGVKVSLYNECPRAVIADTMILKDAPERMLQAGLGDMLAKYSAICEWRISNVVTGEYYCEEIAEMMRASLRRIIACAPKLKERDPEVIKEIIEGLIVSGIAMSFAGTSRPASGLEHYFSHLWEMMALARGGHSEQHGIQVGVGEYLTMRVMDRMAEYTPEPEKIKEAIETFDEAVWEDRMHRVFGKTADELINKEKSIWRKNDASGRSERAKRILENWSEIQEIIKQEMPDTESVINLMRQAGMPVLPKEIGEDKTNTRNAFLCSRDIRDKYLISSLLWDIGMLDDFPLDTE